MRSMSRAPLRLALLSGAVALAACGDDPVAPVPEVIEEVEFAASLGIDLDEFTETASGLYYLDNVVGTGDAAAAGDTVSVDYVLYLRDGQQLDQGEFAPLHLGEQEAIDGFDEGVRGMQVGGERRIIVPPELAYFGIPNRPQGVLIFDLELTSLNGS